MKFALILFSFSLCCVVHSWAAVNVTLGANFQGSSLGVESSSTPSDCNGTIGPNHFVEFINGTFAVYNRTNGFRVFLSSDVSFWQNAGITFDANAFVSDPRLIYDPTSARWFACQIDVPVSGINNRVLLAVSKTSDPTAGWRAVTIPSDLDKFSDFPTMGIDANALYLAADSFQSSDSYFGQTFTSIPKADLLGTVLDISHRSSSSNFVADGNITTPHPIVNLGGTGPGFILAPDNNGLDFLPHNTLRLIQVDASNTPTATFSEATLITVPTFTVPINPPQPGNPGSDPDNGDCRFSAKPYQVGNVIYAAHTVDSPNGEIHHSVIRWYRINATTKTLIESGTISNAVHLFYPSICANTNGVIVINMNGCSETQFISSYAVVGEAVNNATTFGDLILLRAGTATYDNGGIGFTSRWGDYSAVTPDPNNAEHFWAIQNIATGQTRWSTQITEIIAVVQPSLSVEKSANNISLRWLSSTSSGFLLEETPSLNPPIIWNAVTTSPVSANGTNSVTLPANQPMDYFRLRR
ncbi:MAG: hypothetical protein JWN25_1640 [Verrucomicrobiales bacterium]|nr:hypothetical protein [Verrucomicrobiales bacterium]